MGHGNFGLDTDVYTLYIHSLGLLMQIRDFVWDVDNIDHIACHGVTPEEVEEVCYRKKVILKGRLGRYYVPGRTEGGRYLLCAKVS